MKKIILITLIASLGTSRLTAQTLSDEDIRSQFIKDWERAKAYTIDYLNTMPSDRQRHQSKEV